MVASQPATDEKDTRGSGSFDPDGAAHEVMLQRPGFADSDMLERAVWTTVTPEQP